MADEKTLNPFTAPLDDPRMMKMQEETASVWERDAPKTSPVSTPAVPADVAESVAFLRESMGMHPKLELLITAATSSQSLRDENTAFREALAHVLGWFKARKIYDLDGGEVIYSFPKAESLLSTYRGKEASDAIG